MYIIYTTQHKNIVAAFGCVEFSFLLMFEVLQDPARWCILIALNSSLLHRHWRRPWHRPALSICYPASRVRTTLEWRRVWLETGGPCPPEPPR